MISQRTLETTLSDIALAAEFDIFVLRSGAHSDMYVLSHNTLVLDPAPPPDGAPPANDAVCHSGIILHLRQDTHLRRASLSHPPSLIDRPSPHTFHDIPISQPHQENQQKPWIRNEKGLECCLMENVYSSRLITPSHAVREYGE
jgi:hypothetical protein